MNIAALCLATLLLCAAQSPAWAKTVWRCGAGGASYSDEPCAGGKAVQLQDGRSSSDVQRGANETQRMQALADRMRNERLAEEARLLASNGHAGNLGGSRAKELHLVKLKKQVKTRSGHSALYRVVEDDGIFQATAPQTRRKRD